MAEPEPGRLPYPIGDRRPLAAVFRPGDQNRILGMFHRGLDQPPVFPVVSVIHDDGRKTGTAEPFQHALQGRAVPVNGNDKGDAEHCVFSFRLLHARNRGPFQVFPGATLTDCILAGGASSSGELLALLQIAPRGELHEAAHHVTVALASRRFDFCAIVNARPGRCGEAAVARAPPPVQSGRDTGGKCLSCRSAGILPAGLPERGIQEKMPMFSVISRVLGGATSRSVAYGRTSPTVPTPTIPAFSPPSATPKQTSPPSSPPKSAIRPSPAEAVARPPPPFRQGRGGIATSRFRSPCALPPAPLCVLCGKNPPNTMAVSFGVAAPEKFTPARRRRGGRRRRGCRSRRSSGG